MWIVSDSMMMPSNNSDDTMALVQVDNNCTGGFARRMWSEVVNLL